MRVKVKVKIGSLSAGIDNTAGIPEEKKVVKEVPKEEDAKKYPPKDTPDY